VKRLGCNIGNRGCTIVIVNYRDPGRVKAATAAARRFLGETAPVIAVDNSPHSEGLADSGFLVICNESNLGYAAAVNAAVRSAKTPLLLLLNPDITSFDGTFGAIAAAFADEGVAAVSPQLLDVTGELQRSCRRAPRPFDFFSESLSLATRFPSWDRPRRLRMLDWDYADERDVDAATGACLFIRRSAFDVVGAFDERFFVYGEEIDWLIRAQKLGYRTRYLPAVKVTHIGGASTPTSLLVLDRLLIESHYRYVGKHFGRTSELALRAALLSLDAMRVLRQPLASRREFVSRARVHLGLKYERPA
jgi:GT2 family glycosyltransferase